MERHGVRLHGHRSVDEEAERRHGHPYCGFDPPQTASMSAISSHFCSCVAFNFLAIIPSPSQGDRIDRIQAGRVSSGIFFRKQRSNQISIKSQNSLPSSSISTLIQIAKLVNNADWTAQISFLDFLRDVGKHFSVNKMVAKENVRARMEDREVGISYTEFSYMLLQAFDFYHLCGANDCLLQIGGADQWGNITAGIELCHKKLRRQAYGLTLL